MPCSYKDFTYTNLATMQADIETFKRDPDPDSTERLAEGARHTGALPAAYKLPDVCADCNNGWMSRLEDAAQKLIVGFIEGKRKTLAPFDQVLLASWMVKTCLTYDAARSPRRIPETVGTRQFFALGLPLAGVQVAIGNDPHHTSDGSLVHGRGLLTGPAVPLGTTVAKFVFQFDPVLLTAIIPYAETPTPWPTHSVSLVLNASYFEQIWPPSGRRLVWPSDSATTKSR